MSKFERVVSLVAASVAAGLWLSAQVVTVQPVIDLPRPEGAVWNLSSPEPLGKEIDLKIAQGDSLTSVWLPDTRFDFVTEGDTVALACEETRVFRVVFAPASVEWSASGEALAAPFAAHGRMYQSEYIDAEGMASVQAPARVTLISFAGDTVPGARLDRSCRTIRWSVSPDSTVAVASLPDSLTFTTRIDRLRLTAPGENFPRAMKRVVTTSWMGQTLTADSTAWVMTTPTGAAPRLRRHDDTMPPGGGDPSMLPGGDLPAVTVTTGPDGITIVPSAGSDTGSAGALRIAVNDIVGRSYIDTYIPVDSQTTIDTSSLPAGEYLIQLLSGSTPVSATKYVKK